MPNPLHDFRLEILSDGRCVIHPDSIQAKEWMYSHMNESSDRYGTAGYVMTADESDAVIAGMVRDKLMSEFDLHIGLEELSKQSWNQQNQDDVS